LFPQVAKKNRQVIVARILVIEDNSLLWIVPVAEVLDQDQFDEDCERENLQASE